jgi:outer membrane protein OmpA-like peptidoglycan-associated protein
VASLPEEEVPAHIPDRPIKDDTLRKVTGDVVDTIASPVVAVQTPDPAPVATPSDDSEQSGLLDIYFDFGKATINPAAAQVLDGLVKTILENPDKSVELSAHTDARGNDAFNLALSQKRATSVMNYLISKGVAKSRISAKGYGETKLLNRCGNGVSCSEEEHKLNRRTAFKLVKK